MPYLPLLFFLKLTIHSNGKWYLDSVEEQCYTYMPNLKYKLMVDSIGTVLSFITLSNQSCDSLEWKPFQLVYKAGNANFVSIALLMVSVVNMSFDVFGVGGGVWSRVGGTLLLEITKRDRGRETMCTLIPISSHSI